MDIKRVAFETRPVKSVRPVASAQRTVAPPIQTSMREPAIAGGKINRQEIAAIVDRFLAGRELRMCHHRHHYLNRRSCLKREVCTPALP
jgi:hypothetical protein